MAIGSGFIPDIQDGDVNPLPRPFQEIGTAGAITIADGTVHITAGTNIAVTIASPQTYMNGARLRIMDFGGAAHTVTYATTGFNSAGTSSDVATFDGNIGSGFELEARGGVWYVLNFQNVSGVTFA